MGVVVVVPLNCYPLAQEVLGDGIKHPIEFEGCVAFCIPTGSSARTRLCEECCAANYVGYGNTFHTKDMWKDTLRFDAQGTAIINQPWQIDNDLAYMIFKRLEERARTGELHEFTSSTLLQYAAALTGPDFIGDQLEYGKRCKLRKMLLS